MIEPILNKYTNIIFLDHDGVLNCQLFYTEKFAHLERFDGIPLYKVVKKYLHKLVKQKEINDLDYYKSETSLMRIELLNWLCKETNSAVVITASLRSGWSVEDLQKIYNYCGATFTIIDKTGHCADSIRGVEIYNWLKDNCYNWFGVHYFDFHRYAIIDDDDDYLINQQYNFFKVDSYCGLTATVINNARKFLTHKTF